jgi:hypothetical protein
MEIVEEVRIRWILDIIWNYSDKDLLKKLDIGNE